LFYLTPEDFLLGRVDERLNERIKKTEAARNKRMENSYAA